jgi:hypothetical protein
MVTKKRRRTMETMDDKERKSITVKTKLHHAIHVMDVLSGLTEAQDTWPDVSPVSVNHLISSALESLYEVDEALRLREEEEREAAISDKQPTSKK